MTMITTTYPLGDTESRIPSAAAPVRAWGFWATLGWFGLAAVTCTAAMFLCGVGYAVWWALNYPNIPIPLDSPTVGYLASVVSMPAAALVLMLAARRGGSMSSYLGLVWPHWRHMLVGLGLLIATCAFGHGLYYLFPSFDQTGEMIIEYRAIMGSPTALVLYWMTLVVTAPVAEEIIFRGFLMRGWSESRLGIAGTILLTSAVFAAIHLQYNVVTLLMVFALGVVLGVMRWRSGSTLLPIMMHAAWNLSAGVWFMMSV